MRKLSVVLTAYNSAPFIAETVESALRQSFGDFELIAVDDGSTDGTGEILDRFSDPRLQVIHQRNQGAPASLNAGLCLAQGEYIALLDGDDLWHPDKLRSHVACLDAHPETDLTFDWSIWIDRAGRETGLHSRRCHGVFSFSALLEDFVIGNTSSTVLRRSALDKAGYCDLRFQRYYDTDLFLRIALLREGNVRAIPQSLTYYRRHGEQMTRALDVMQEEWTALIRKFRSIAPIETNSAARRGSSNMRRYFAVVAYESGDFALAFRLLTASFRAAPTVFLSEWRNWQVTAAALAGLLLPASASRRLERLAGLRTAGSHVRSESHRHKTP